MIIINITYLFCFNVADRHDFWAASHSATLVAFVGSDGPAISSPACAPKATNDDSMVYTETTMIYPG